MPDPRDPDGPKPGEKLIELALRLAVQLALELEQDVAEPDGVPETFVVYGRAAALTLVASQVRRTTDDLAKVLVEPGDRLDYTSGRAVRKALASVLDKAPEDGVAERLVDFARGYCPLDDQAHYNLYRYHRTRAKILENAIDGWYRERPPTSYDEWSAWKSKVSDLKARFAAELDQMEVSVQHVEQAGDPALMARVTAISTLDPRPGNGRWDAAEESLRPEPPLEPGASGLYLPRHGQANPDSRLDLPGGDEDPGADWPPGEGLFPPDEPGDPDGPAT